MPYPRLQGISQSALIWFAVCSHNSERRPVVKAYSTTRQTAYILSSCFAFRAIGRLHSTYLMVKGLQLQ
jgi:hypothetical protein